ncbi:MAG: amidohydrolase family protein [Candidatus Acidiferrum sp.]
MRFSAIVFAVFASAAAVGSARAQTVAITADHLYSMDGAAAQGGPGLVLIRNGKIEAVRSGANLTAPAGYQAIHGVFVTPGFIDTDTTTGISGAYNISADQDQDESTDPNTADVRVRDSLNPQDLLYRYVNSFGVTTLQVAPGQHNPIAGVAGIFKTVGPQSGIATVDQLALRAESAMVFNLGEVPKQTYGATRKAPMTRMKTAEIIRHALLDAQQYHVKWEKWQKDGSDPAKQPTVDTKSEILAEVVSGKLPAIFAAYRADDIDTAIRIGTEFHLKYAIASATEAYLTTDAIRKAGVPVLLGPVMQAPYTHETANVTYENAALVSQANIPMALMTGYEAYVPKSRVLVFEAAIAAANGLGLENALRAITISAAKLLGIDGRLGSLTAGKDADVVVFDGDPFEYTSHVQTVVVGGAVTYQRTP